jgi:hypothetical protein
MYASSIVLLALSALIASANPLQQRTHSLCPAGVYSNPQCCSPELLGAAAVDCSEPTGEPSDTDDFKYECSEIGKAAKCCALPVVSSIQ